MRLRLWQEEDGVLSFEWTLLGVLLVVGIVSGVTAARDAIIDELGDTAEAVLAWNQSYSIAEVPGVFPAVIHTDFGHSFLECDRGDQRATRRCLMVLKKGR